MAVNIRIGTAFDPIGLNQAQKALGKVQGNFRNLGRNFAIAGVAFAGAASIIVKSARDLARIEKINTQTEAVLKSMGNSAGVTAEHIEGLAGDLEKLTASEAETIQEGANLLLTFRNIQNQVGTNNDIFDQAVKMSVDLAQAMGTTASGEAIRLGKALNDPVKGVSALTRVGVSFTQQQKDQIKTLQESGDMLGAQKIILGELQAQFGGSGEAFAGTFAGQVALLTHELGALGEEATLSVMPALQTMVETLRELAPEIGAKLTEAIASVDFEAFALSIINVITFLVENAETIMKVVTALFVLNTTYNVVRAATGLFSAAAFILGNTFVVTAGKIGLATGAVKLFRTALITTGIGALVVGLGFIIEAIINTNEAAQNGTQDVDDYGAAVRRSATKTTNASVEMDKARPSINAIERAYENARIAAAAFAATAAGQGIDTSSLAGVLAISGGKNPFEKETPLPSRVEAGSRAAEASLPKLSGLPSLIAEANKNARQVTNAGIRQTKLGNAGLSKEVAAWVSTSAKPIKTSNQALARIARNGSKAIANITKAYNNSATGQAAASQAAAEASSAAAAAHNAFVEAERAAAQKEADALAERERVYQSFLNSVKSTFAGIKNSILGAFDLTALGGSTDSITRNIDKLLGKLRSFTANVRNLAGMGLDPALLQQVISAGPIAGARLASALVAGGAGALTNINRGFTEFGDLSGQVATTGTESLFNRPTQQSIFNINVSGGVGSGATIGQAIVEAIKAYERTSGAVFQGA